MDWFDFFLVGTDGTRKMRITGAVIGALIGALVGFLIGFATVQVVPLWLMVGYTGLGGLIGAVLGAIFAGFMFIALIFLGLMSIWGISKFVMGL